MNLKAQHTYSTFRRLEMADLQNTLGDLSQIKRVKMTKSVTLKWKWKNSIYKEKAARRQDETHDIAYDTRPCL